MSLANTTLRWYNTRSVFPPSNLKGSLMSHVASGTVYEHTITGEQDGQLIVMVNHWSFYDLDPQSQTNMDIADVAAYLESNYLTHVLPLQLDSFSLRSQKTLAIGSSFWNVGTNKFEDTILAKDERAVAGSGSIVASSDPMPTFNAVGVRKLVDKQGKAYRGSCRLLCLQESDCTQNAIAQAKIDSVKAGMDSYFGESNVTSGPETQLLYSVVFGRSLIKLNPVGEPNPGTNTSAAVLGSFINKFVSSQVSRKKRDRLG